MRSPHTHKTEPSESTSGHFARAPLGMQGKHQKLSDFFINEKIPQGARAKWPLVLSEGSILWVSGLRISQAWRLIGDEPEILHLRLVPPKR